jgi:hypothetical protein
MEEVPKPTCGRIVHFVNASGEIRAAIVIKDPEIPDMTADLTVFNEGGPQVRDAVPYSSEHKPYTWHWMAYQLGQASLGKKPGT